MSSLYFEGRLNDKLEGFYRTELSMRVTKSIWVLEHLHLDIGSRTSCLQRRWSDLTTRLVNSKRPSFVTRSSNLRLSKVGDEAGLCSSSVFNRCFGYAEAPGRFFRLDKVQRAYERPIISGDELLHISSKVMIVRAQSRHDWPQNTRAAEHTTLSLRHWQHVPSA